MFGMPGMGGPQPIPNHEAYPMFWANLNRLLLVSAITMSVAASIRWAEGRTHQLLLNTI